MRGHADTTPNALSPMASQGALPTAPRLTDLARVVYEVVSAPDLGQALTRVVEHVRATMAVDSCEAYLGEPGTGDQVLLAASGLPERLLGKVRFGPGEGLIGQVAERAGPIALADATGHPDYIFHRKTGEGDCPGFLGVPLTCQGQVLGVLLVRRRARGGFSDTDEAFLLTLAAQLAGAVANAHATSGDRKTIPLGRAAGRCLSGQASAPGVSLGTAVVLSHPMVLDEVPDRAAGDIETESLAFQAAIAHLLEEIALLRSSPAVQGFQPVRDHLRCLCPATESDELQLGTLERIQAGHWATGVLRQTIEAHLAHFAAMDDPYLRERGGDLRGLGQRILARLIAGARKPAYQAGTVLVGEHTDAMDIAGVPAGLLSGIEPGTERFHDRLDHLRLRPP